MIELQRLGSDFTVCKIDSLDVIDFTKEFVFVSKTDDEISLFCKSDNTPSNTIASESGWRGLKISGILDFGMIGVISKISNLLAANMISIFVISTYNTDYIFVKVENYEKCIQILICNGYVIK